MRASPFYQGHVLSIVGRVGGILVQTLIVGGVLGISKEGIILLTDLNDLLDFVLDVVLILVSLVVMFLVAILLVLSALFIITVTIR